MGIDGIKKAFTGFVKEASKQTAQVAGAVARQQVLSAKLTDVNVKLAGLKGWGPEVKAQRTALEEQRRGIQDELKATQKLIPSSQDVIRNIR